MIAFQVKTLRAIYRPSDGHFWASNVEHGSGWSKSVRQAWTEREARLEIRKLFEFGWVGADDVLAVPLWPDIPQRISP